MFAGLDRRIMVYFIDGLEIYRRDLKIKELAEGSQLEHYFEWGRDVQDAWHSDSIFGKKSIWLELEQLEANKDFEKDLSKSDEWLNDFIVTVPAPHTKLKVYKKLIRCGEHYTFNKLEGKDLKTYVLRGLKLLNASMTEDAYQLFVNRSCYHEKAEITLYTISIQLKQLAYAEPNITVNTVDAIIPKFLDEDMMKLSSLLFCRDKKGFMDLVVDLILTKHEPISMLGLLLRSFRIAYKANLFRDRKDDELCRLLNISSWQMSTFKEVRSLSDQQILECIHTLEDAATDIKSGRKAGPVAFQIAMGKLVQCIC